MLKEKLKFQHENGVAIACVEKKEEKKKHIERMRHANIIHIFRLHV